MFRAAVIVLCLFMPEPQLQPHSYSKATLARPLPLRWTDPGHEYATRFASLFKTKELIKSCKDDSQRVQTIASWMSQTWKKPPATGATNAFDPITVLTAAQKEGAPTWRFASTLKAALASIDILSRSVALHVQDVETIASGATALGLEVYLNDEKRWIYIDSDWQSMPLYNGKTVNLVELQKAIVTDRENVQLIDFHAGLTPLPSSQKDCKEYVDHIIKHLFYFTTQLDQRVDRENSYGEDQIMLTPMGSKRPRVYQIDKGGFTNTQYFDTLDAYYRAPDIALSNSLERPRYASNAEKRPENLQLGVEDPKYFSTLIKDYDLNALIAGKKTDIEKAAALCEWANTRWSHNGSNEPKKPDPLTILDEAKRGANFRCVEYSTILAASLNAVGIPARSLNIQHANAQLTETGGAHQIVEAYSHELKKWFVLDGQFGVVPAIDGRPLNAVEFKAAIADQRDKIVSLSKNPKPLASYLRWVEPYLYFLWYYFDERWDTATDYHRPCLMLVPEGAQAPTLFQRRFPVPKGRMETKSLKPFYQQP